MSRRALTLFSILIFSILSVGLLLSWYTASITPWLHGAAFVSVVLIVSLGFRSDTGRREYYWSLIMAALIGVVLRAPMVLFPGTLSSNDPEKFALYAHLTLESGSYRLPAISFYGIAGGFHTYIAQTAAVAGIAPEEAMVTVGILFGLWGPLLAAAVCVLILGHNNLAYRAGVIAAAIATISALSVRAAYIPRAYSMGAVLFITCIFAVLYHIRLNPKQQQASWILLLILLIGMAFTHKLPLLIATSLLFTGWLTTKSSTVDRIWPWESNRHFIPMIVVLVAGVITLVQQTIITDYSSRAVEYTRATANTSFQSPTRLGAHPEAAALVDMGYLAIFGSHSHLPVLLFLGGIAWLIVAWQCVIKRNGNNGVVIALLTIIAAVTVLVITTLAGSVLPGGIEPMRLHLYQELFLASLIGVGYLLFVSELIGDREFAISRTQLSTLCFVILCVALSFHAFASIASPDYYGEERSYVTEGEIVGKEFAADHVETEVWTDDLIQRRAPSPAHVTDKQSPYLQLGAPPDDGTFLTNNIDLLQGTATDEGQETILYRQNEQVYSSRGTFNDYRYQVMWNVEQSADNRYHRVYDNGHSLIYRNPH